jgi:SAM-dependent methyltransferase
VGCGSLRAGRFLIPYLAAGNYYGIEARESVLQDGIDREVGRELIARKHPTFEITTDFALDRFGVQFDVVLAQSIFSHTFEDLTRHAFGKIASVLKPDGVLVATFVESVPLLPPGFAKPERPTTGSGWLNGVVTYRWREIHRLLQGAGMDGKPVRWWHHRQTWFVAALPSGQDALQERLRGMRQRLFGAPRALRVAPGLTARLGLLEQLRRR